MRWLRPRSDTGSQSRDSLASTKHERAARNAQGTLQLDDSAVLGIGDLSALYFGDAALVDTGRLRQLFLCPALGVACFFECELLSWHAENLLL